MLSAWGVAEVITWNRALSDSEMQSATTYLMSKLNEPKKAKSTAPKVAVADASGDATVNLYETHF